MDASNKKNVCAGFNRMHVITKQLIITGGLSHGWIMLTRNINQLHAMKCEGQPLHWRALNVIIHGRKKASALNLVQRTPDPFGMPRPAGGTAAGWEGAADNQGIADAFVVFDVTIPY